MSGVKLAWPLGDVDMKNGDVIECKISAVDSASKAKFNMVHHYRVTATAGNIATWTQNVRNSYYNALVSRPPRQTFRCIDAIWPISLTFFQLDTFNINTPDEQASVSIVASGTIGRESYDPRAAILVRFGTGMRGRSFKGAGYYPPPAEEDVNDGKLENNATFLGMSTFIAQLRVLGTAAEQGHLVVYSRKLSTEQVIFSTIVDQITYSTTLSSQRRRRRRLV
jgi:hypothetical protein